MDKIHFDFTELYTKETPSPPDDPIPAMVAPFDIDDSTPKMGKLKQPSNASAYTNHRVPQAWLRNTSASGWTLLNAPIARILAPETSWWASSNTFSTLAMSGATRN